MVAPAANLASRLQSSYYGQNQRAWSRMDAGAAGYPDDGFSWATLRIEHATRRVLSNNK